MRYPVHEEYRHAPACKILCIVQYALGFNLLLLKDQMNVLMLSAAVVKGVCCMTCSAI